MSEDFYSPVQRRIWHDAGFRKLSKPAPNARDLFIYLLTTPRATQVPGLIAIGESAMAEDLDWPVAGLRKALAEVEAAGMVRVDRDARLLWLPNALRHNQPRSPDNVKGWTKLWRMLPECALLRAAAEAMMAALAARGPTFAAAFARVTGLPAPETKAPPEGGPMVGPEVPPPPAPQEQDQEQEQQENTHFAGARGNDQDDGPRLQPCFEADIAALLREIPVLAELADDAGAVTDLHSGYCMANGDAATVDMARWAIGKVVAAENLREMAPRQRRERVGRYLGNARKYYRESDRPSEPRSMSPDARLTLEIFGEVWAARKRREFVASAGDDKHASELAALAREHATGRLRTRPSDIIRYWAEKHLASQDRLVVDSDHALRTLRLQLTSYGLPKAPADKPAAPPAAPPGEPLVTAPGSLAAAIAGVGTNGSAMPSRRRS